MGHIAQFNLGLILGTYGTPVFLETGTAHGASLRYAQRFGFRRLLSIEVDPDLVERAIIMFRDDERVSIVPGDTLAALPDVLAALNNEGAPSLCCWLDAHYPAGLTATMLPLIEELNLLAQYPTFRSSVILIDDRRIYEPDDYTGGNLPADCVQGDGQALRDFEDRIVLTHEVERSCVGEGSIAFYPRYV